jgi:hypothetical protein
MERRQLPEFCKERLPPESVHSLPHPTSRNKASSKLDRLATLLCLRLLVTFQHNMDSWKNKAMFILLVPTKRYSYFQSRHGYIPRGNAAIV